MKNNFILTTQATLNMFESYPNDEININIVDSL